MVLENICKIIIINIYLRLKNLTENVIYSSNREKTCVLTILIDYAINA